MHVSRIFIAEGKGGLVVVIIPSPLLSIFIMPFTTYQYLCTLENERRGNEFY